MLNISEATLLAMKRALYYLKIKPNFIFVDGNRCPNIKIPCLSIIKGDSILPEISAASIIAKVHRDKEMKELSNIFPMYGFNKHKGYPTTQHLYMLNKYGVTKHHRYSFSTIRNILKKDN